MSERGTANQPRRVVLFGASGTIGEAVLKELLGQGHQVHAVFREGTRALPQANGCTVHLCDLAGDEGEIEAVLAKAQCEVVISCLASRSGAPDDAWAIDYSANSRILAAAEKAGVSQMILLSAICVQKPLLAFQDAKLAFEAELMQSRLTWTIVRPTAFFKSLSGQVDRVRKGKPFLLFGDGTLTRCKPISDADLARYIVTCIEDVERHNRVLPIGGPGPAIMPIEQGERLFAMTGKPPRFRRIPVGLLNGVIGGLSVLGKVSKRAANAAEYARIARYYATESMLVLDPETGRYDEKATPEFGSDTLVDHYARMLGTSPKA